METRPCCFLCRYVISDASSSAIEYVYPSEDDLKLVNNATTYTALAQGKFQKNQTYYCHSYCKAFVKREGKDLVTPERLLRFAQSSMRLFRLSPEASSDSGSDSDTSYTDFHSAAPTAVTDSALSDEKIIDIMESIVQLPADLQKTILDYAGTCAISSLVNILYTGVNECLQNVALHPILQTKCPIAIHMTFNFVFIEDSWCWCGCTTDKGIIGYKGTKPIPAEIPPDVNSVRFAVGCFGIQGMQFRGTYGTSKPIGDFDGGLWVGEIASRSPLQHLQLGLDGLKVRTLNVSNRRKRFRDQFMWRETAFTVADAAIKRDAYFERNAWLSAANEISGFPGLRPMQHLPLWKRDSVLYGLTVYCGPGGAIEGMESHFRWGENTSSSSIGYKAGCAICFILADSEYFNGAWAMCDENVSLSGPFLLLRTSRDRIALFQPMIPGLVPRLLRTGMISGIYCNAQWERIQNFESIGITYIPDQKVVGTNGETTYDLLQYDSSLRAPPTGTFASKVVLKDIFTIRACYMSNRCTGMAFTFAMGRTEILGQWFECTGRHDLIFDTAIGDRDLLGLRFQLHGPRHKAVVRKVMLLTTEPGDVSPEEPFLDAKCPDTVVWMYSERSDEIITQ